MSPMNFTPQANEPFAPEPAPLPPHITLLALLNRLTLAERTAVRGSADEVVLDLMFLLQAAKYVDLSRAQTADGIRYLEATGLLAAGRADEVLLAPITPEERP